MIAKDVVTADATCPPPHASKRHTQLSVGWGLCTSKYELSKNSKKKVLPHKSQAHKMTKFQRKTGEADDAGSFHKYFMGARAAQAAHHSTHTEEVWMRLTQTLVLNRHAHPASDCRFCCVLVARPGVREIRSYLTSPPSWKQNQDSRARAIKVNQCHRLMEFL